jgi:hypothetical protein
MFSTSRLIALTAALFIFGLADTAAAQVVVLTARGPSARSFPQGTILPAKRMLALKPGDRLEVLDGAGSRVLTGPGNMVAGRVDTGARTTLLALFQQGRERRPGIAAVRSVEQAERPPAPGLWQLDVARSGNFCVTPGQTPSLWRDLASGPAQLVVIRATTGQAQTLVWPAGAPDLAWPDALPLTDGESYEVLLEDRPARKVHLRRLAAAPAALADLAAALLDKGCYGQMDSLQAALEAAPAS